MDVIKAKKDLTYLTWTKIRNSSGTAGSFLKAYTETDKGKTNYDAIKGIVGHECVNEIVVDRLLSILGIEHLNYELLHADVMVETKMYDTYLCASKDFKNKGESKIALDAFFQAERFENETPMEFCIRQGWEDYIYKMIVVDFLILNRDRHGANIEVLRNTKNKTVRLAPLFDHGLSFLCSCYSDEEVERFDILADKPCQNFIGSRSTFENLNLISEKSTIFQTKLKLHDKEILFENLAFALSETHMCKIWDMLWARWCKYEELCNL